MKIEILEFIEGARQAGGLTVIIDVFRAFSLECYLFAKGAGAIYPVGSIELALDLKKRHPEYLLIGERGGAKYPGCDYGNSPFQTKDVNVLGKTIIHTTSAGTQGIVNARHADEILTGSLVNAKAVSHYIQRRNPERVSLVCMGNGGKWRANEDVLCARYIRSLLTGEEINLKSEIENLKRAGGEHFFKEDMQEIFPREDFAFCVDYDRFPFVIRVEEEAPGCFRSLVIGEDTWQSGE